MKFLKALISWKLWLAIILGLGFVVACYYLTFEWLEDYTNHGKVVEVPDISDMKINEAIATLEDMHLEYAIDSVKFSEDVEPYAIIDFYPVAGSKVKPGRKVFIKSNPSDYLPVELPNIIDRSKRMAFTQLAMKDLAVGDTIYEEDPAKDAVLRVMYNNKVIQAGTVLPRGTKVDLVLGKGYDIDVEVPNLLGLGFHEAKQVLREKHFVLGPVRFVGGSNDSIYSSVVYQDPPSTDIYDEGLPISIWLSEKNRGELRGIIDSLDIVFRRRMDKDDSLYYNSVQRSNELDISDLPDAIQDQVKNDSRAQNNMELNLKQQKPKTPVIDTTGITIE